MGGKAWQECTPQLITGSPHRADDNRSSTTPSSQVLGLPLMPRVEQRQDGGEEGTSSLLHKTHCYSAVLRQIIPRETVWFNSRVCIIHCVRGES